MAFGEPFKKEIRVKVKKSEQEQKKDELVAVDREINETLAEKAGEMADFNDRLKKLRERQRKLLGVINDGEEIVEVECVERVNERLGKVETVRKDTGQIIDERPLTGEERQLDIAEAKPKKRGSKPEAGAEA